MTQMAYSHEANESTMHWLRFFLTVFEGLDVKFESVEPSPVDLIRQVLQGVKSLDEMQAVANSWSDEFDDAILLRRAELGSEVPISDKVTAAPIMVAMLVCGIREIHKGSVESVLNYMDYIGEWFEDGMKSMGYDIRDFYELWRDFWDKWEYAKLA